MILSDPDRRILHSVHAAGAASVTVKTLTDYLPEGESDRTQISGRLCKLRTKGLVTNDQIAGANLWTLTDEGMAAIAPDMKPVSEPAIPEPTQPDRVDISADIHAVFSAADIPEFSDPNPPVCADIDTRPEWPDVSEDLLEEASSLFLMTPFPRLHDAIYVLHTLAEFLSDRPAMAYELERVAAYLVEETP